MTLSIEWFNKSEARQACWDKDGLSLNDVEKALAHYNSDDFPIALEMAEYLFSCWSARRIAMLPIPTRDVLFEIWDKHLAKSL
ncbi:hypothetical protein A3K86_20240 [Photobacterium jeanii]|uniref:Uncharacterized protein n=1 Tax=Photobacterium jeanii TaxID=858640 RepID=A0A178K1U4_9GAMM|nr:hypothetical protein [Photobacterium jeanii]OAN11288.1 hypothetical protein A3K86_20240 [Photobacterium jeanii]PST90808.1 hypothetical protein C9I91_09350 [Photobacterium jeanii]